MPEQKEGEEDKEVDIKPTKGDVSDEYLKGYRVGYNRAVKRFKRNKLEVEVKRDKPLIEKKEGDRKEDKVVEQKNDNRFLMLVIVVIILAWLVYYFVVRNRDNKSE